MFEYSKTDLIILLPSLALFIILSIALRFILKNKSERVKNIPFIIISAILVILEIIKQIINFTSEEINLFSLPFHYCSLFVYFFPLAHFTKGKVKDFFTPVAFITALAMSIVFYFCPRGIIGDSTNLMFEEFLPFHSVTFHLLVIFYTILYIALNLYTPTKKGTLNLIITMLIYCAIAIPLAHVLQTNYCNFLECTVPIVANLQLTIGMFWYTIIMIIIIGLGPALLNVIYLAIYNALNKKNN